jgi:hypothetical protein
MEAPLYGGQARIHARLWDEQARMCACLWGEQYVRACGVTGTHVCAPMGLNSPRLGGKADGCKNSSFLEILMCLCSRWLI